MSKSTFRHDVERFVRDEWLAPIVGQGFREANIALHAGGEFQCDAVSEDRKILASICTNAGKTISLKRSKKATPKLHKVRSDILYMMCAEAERRIVILTDRNMYDLCMEQVNAGRMPVGIEFLLAEIPSEMLEQLGRDHYHAACEVIPGMPGTQI